MIFVNPVPAVFITGAYYEKAGTDYYLSPEKLESDYAAVRFERERRLFRKYCQHGEVLDVGCSSGGFLYQLGRAFPGAYQLLGTDASGPALQFAASQGISMIQGDFVQQDFGARRFDAITFWAVLEHLFEPKAFLQKAAAILKPDGCCFVLVPNMRSLAVRLLGRRYRYIYPQHLNYFSARTLRRLVLNDFCVVELRSMHFNPIVIWQDWRGGGADVSNQQRGELLKRTTRLKQNPLLKPLKAGYRLVESGLSLLNLADNLAVVLRKRS